MHLKNRPTYFYKCNGTIVSSLIEQHYIRNHLFDTFKCTNILNTHTHSHILKTKEQMLSKEIEQV